MRTQLLPFTKLLLAMPALAFCLTFAQAQQAMPPFIEVAASADSLIEPDELLYSILLNPNALYGYAQEDYYAENMQQEREAQMQLKRQQAHNQLLDFFKQAGITDKQLVNDPYSIDDPNTAMYRAYNVRFSNKQQLEKLVKLLQGNELYTGRVADMESSKKTAVYDALTAIALKKARDKAAKMAKSLNLSIGPVLEIVELNPEVYTTPNVNYNLQYHSDAAQYIVDPSQYQYMIQAKATVRVKFALQ